MDLKISEIDYLIKLVGKQKANPFTQELHERFQDERRAQLNMLLPPWTHEEMEAFNSI